MSENQLKYVSGEFEGYFYTHQKMPMGELEKLPGGDTHQVHIYRGELKDYEKLHEYKPEDHLNREGLLLHNVTNIQLSNSAVSDKRIYDFDQLVLKNVQVEQSWELDGKTYGIINGSLVGKIKQQAIPGPPNPQGTIPPPPTPPPKNPDKKWWNTIPPIVGGTSPAPPIGASNRRGCLSWFWDVLKWLLLILLLIFLYKTCINDDNCCSQVEIIREKNDSLTHIIDSLRIENDKKDSINKEREENELQEEINNIAEQIFFYKGRDVIRDYSIYQLDNLIRILNKYPGLKIKIEGHVNGSSTDPNLDLKRAERVKKLLIEKGIAEYRLQTVGMGGSVPIDDPDNQQGVDPWGESYNRNMRVEIKIQK